jgi:hypothetical protein
MCDYPIKIGTTELCPDHPFYVLADEIDYQYDPTQVTPYEVTAQEVLAAFNQITTNDIVPNFDNVHQACLSDSDLHMAASQSRLTRFGFPVYADNGGNISESYYSNIDAFINFVSKNTEHKIYRFPKCVMFGSRFPFSVDSDNDLTDNELRTTNNENDAVSDWFEQREFEFINTFVGPFREIVRMKLTLEQKEVLYYRMQIMDVNSHLRFVNTLNNLNANLDERGCFKAIQRIMEEYRMPFFFEEPTLTIHYLDYEY